MQRFFDYSNGKIDYSNKFRIKFINRMAYLMQQIESSSKEVNELIDWLFCLTEGVEYKEPSLDIISHFEEHPIKQIDKDKLIKEVDIGDFNLYSYAVLLHELDGWTNKDILTEIISEFYHRLDYMIHPYREEEKGRDLEDIKYYVELDYESKE